MIVVSFISFVFISFCAKRDISSTFFVFYDNSHIDVGSYVSIPMLKVYEYWRYTEAGCQCHPVSNLFTNYLDLIL